MDNLDCMKSDRCILISVSTMRTANIHCMHVIRSMCLFISSRKQVNQIIICRRLPLLTQLQKQLGGEGRQSFKHLETGCLRLSTPEGGRSNKRSRSGHPSATALFQSDSTDSTDTTTTTVTAAAAAATTTTNATETAAATTAVAASTRVAAVTTSTAAPAAAAATAAPAPPPAPARSHTIQYGHTAHQNATGANLSMKNIGLCSVLVDLAKAGAFRVHSEFAKAAIPSKTFGEVSHVKYNFLELVDFVARQDNSLRTDIDLLRQAPREPNPEEGKALDDSGGRIEMACRQMLNTLVPSNVAAKSTFSAFSRRIGMYKQELKEAKIYSGRWGDMRLITREELANELAQREDST
mmetsp:Transcript_21134/g.42354  ORF Transcript_21134/g.42354 Transcript_21134/m.42354 type:complete len:352 (-) Transcript_21134:34-1089(-)